MRAHLVSMELQFLAADIANLQRLGGEIQTAVVVQRHGRGTNKSAALKLGAGEGACTRKEGRGGGFQETPGYTSYILKQVHTYLPSSYT